MSKNLTIPANHPDLEILCKLTNTKSSDMRGASVSGTEAQYLKAPVIRYWDLQNYETLKAQFDKCNEQTSEYRFEIYSTQDREVEWDNDRIWPSSFTFFAHKK